jgi:hypothetical protein
MFVQDTIGHNSALDLADTKAAEAFVRVVGIVVTRLLHPDEFDRVSGDIQHLVEYQPIAVVVRALETGRNRITYR